MEVTTRETAIQAERERERHLTLGVVCACMFACKAENAHGDDGNDDGTKRNRTENNTKQTTAFLFMQ